MQVSRTRARRFRKRPRPRTGAGPAARRSPSHSSTSDVAARELLPDARALDEMEPFYPLRVSSARVLPRAVASAFVSPEEIFSDYAYFSSFSASWLEHGRRYVEQMIDRFGLDATSQVVEIASNDGYLLQYFVERGIPVLGHRAGRQRRRGRAEKRHPDAGRVLRRRRRRSGCGRGRRRRPPARQQRARPRARPERLRGGA